MIRIRQNALVSAFSLNGNYNPHHMNLIRELADYISHVVQDDQCLLNQPLQAGASLGERLKDVMCKFSYAYTPLPIQQMAEKARLVSNGQRIGQKSVNGRIYSNVFDGNQIITKSPVRWQQDDIIEHFISFRVLNSILVHDLLTTHLVPSYGLFVCPSNIPANGSSLNAATPLHICQSPTRKKLNTKPTMFLVQRQVMGNTLGSYIRSGQVTLDELIKYIREVAITLICLENTPYSISHNDLHVENIMIEGRTAASPGHAVIIDWGMSRFVNPSNGERYQPFTYDEYMDNMGPHTGASDYFDLLKNILFDTEHKGDANSVAIHAYVLAKFNSFSGHFRDSNRVQIRSLEYYKNVGHGNYYLFRILKHIEKNKTDHDYHLRALYGLTYRNLFNSWLLADDIREIDIINTALRSPGVFNIPGASGRTPQGVPPPLPGARLPPPLPGARISAKRKCQCYNKSSNKKCTNKVKSNTDFCGIHSNCRRRASPASAVPAVPAVAAVAAIAAVAAVAARCTCGIILKTGARAGQPCGKPCKNGNKCGTHMYYLDPVVPAVASVAAVPAVPAVPAVAAVIQSRCKCGIILKTGARAGQPCGKPCKNGNTCGIHM